MMAVNTEDLGKVVGAMAEKLAAMEGITLHLTPQSQFAVYVRTFQKAIALMQIVVDADWSRFMVPGNKVSLPGFPDPE